jgi:hypothetical protein
MRDKIIGNAATADAGKGLVGIIGAKIGDFFAIFRAVGIEILIGNAAAADARSGLVVVAGADIGHRQADARILFGIAGHLVAARLSRPDAINTFLETRTVANSGIALIALRIDTGSRAIFADLTDLRAAGSTMNDIIDAGRDRSIIIADRLVVGAALDFAFAEIDAAAITANLGVAANGILVKAVVHAFDNDIAFTIGGHVIFAVVLELFLNAGALFADHVVIFAIDEDIFVVLALLDRVAIADRCIFILALFVVGLDHCRVFACAVFAGLIPAIFHLIFAADAGLDRIAIAHGRFRTVAFRLFFLACAILAETVAAVLGHIDTILAGFDHVARAFRRIIVTALHVASILADTGITELLATRRQLILPVHAFLDRVAIA